MSTKATADKTTPALSDVTVVMKCRYCATSMQEAINARVNGFALDLLAESLGDKDALVDGGVMFTFPCDHKGRRTWITVTQRAPEIIFPEATPGAEPVDDLGLGLSVREREVLDLMANGEVRKTIADVLNVSIRTVDYHIGNAYPKLGVKSRHQAIRVYSAAKQRVLLQKGATTHG